MCGLAACSIAKPVALSINFSRSFSGRWANASKVPELSPPDCPALVLLEAVGGGAVVWMMIVSPVEDCKEWRVISRFFRTINVLTAPSSKPWRVSSTPKQYFPVSSAISLKYF